MNVNLILKGFIIGIGKIIPGVSGGVIAISLNLYDKIIYSIIHFLDDVKNNIMFLGIIGIGFVSAIILASKIMIFLLNNYYLPTMLFFIGLIIGGFDYKKLNNNNFKNILYLTIPVISLLILYFWGNNNVVLKESASFGMIIVLGFIDAVTMIIPGISGTAILMMIGYYKYVLTIISNLFMISNAKLVIPFLIGLLSGAFVTLKLIYYLLNNKKEETTYLINGLMIGSVITIILNVFNNSYSIMMVIISLLLLIIGYFISKKTIV